MATGYPEKHGLKVFSTFACGGGSTMGYKLAGFDVLGCLEIDPQIIEVYKANHHPRFAFCEDIRTFRVRDDLPPELFDLDILDGSPPCSSFSTVGNRDKDWGKEKHFREGQTEQRLDDLFFDFIALAGRLQPKVVIAENVKGMIIGKAKGYAKEIKREFEKVGYRVQLFLLNAASMGVPQKRERVFFVCSRNDQKHSELRLGFDGKPIRFGDIDPQPGKAITAGGQYEEYWRLMKPTDKNFADVNKRRGRKPNGFGRHFIQDNHVPGTIVSGDSYFMGSCSHFVSDPDLVKIGSFPSDYNFGPVKPQYLIGMSVPPVMTAQVAHQVYRQWLEPTKAATP
jgi:DNA (cytosine-5)-methyltransferase 1